MNIKRLAPLLILGTLIVLAYFNRDHLQIESLQHWVENAGSLGWIAFVLIYIAATILFLPASLLTLLGGFLFGPVAGTLLNLTGATIGASIAFLIARHSDGGWIRSKAGDKVGNLMDKVDQEGWRAIAFVRLIPLFPFNLLNYVLGLTKIPFGQYALTSVLCMAPATAAYTFFGHTFGLAFSSEDAPFLPYLFAGLILIAVMLVITRLMMKKGSQNA